MSDRVVITGLGTVNALGLSVRETWENVINGVSGVAPITLFDPSELLVQIACEVKRFIPEEHLPAREARRRARFQQFATVAAREAIGQAGLEVAESESGRVGVIVSSAIGGVQAFEDSVYTLME
ncbi:MAG TPA: beta-ketoacyl synthase N-terminal-like domain-containing protein, partial [Anaerolineales bacterium]|nr:beta-ketoacyl synthase N-terminal-like domain-containing protein [Anaerolineales bacterium]